MIYHFPKHKTPGMTGRFKSTILVKRITYSSRLKIPETEHGKPCIAGRFIEAEGYRPYRLRYITFSKITVRL